MRGGDEMGGFGGESRGLEEQEEIRWLFFIILLPEAAAARLTVGLTLSSTPASYTAGRPGPALTVSPNIQLKSVVYFCPLL